MDKLYKNRRKQSHCTCDIETLSAVFVSASKRDGCERKLTMPLIPFAVVRCKYAGFVISTTYLSNAERQAHSR